MASKVIVLQHNPWETPGEFLCKAVEKHRLQMDVIRVWENSIPPLNGYLAMIVLGGGPNVDQEHIYPFLTHEKRTIRKALSRNMPYLGFCLGHQLLADALGAPVGPNFQPSIGFIKGYLTHEGRIHPVFRDLPQYLSLFKWHAQAVHEPLPSQINILATSKECQIEAISLADRPHIIGLQFDNHAAHPQNVKSWLTMDAKWLATLESTAINPGVLVKNAEEFKKTTGEQFIKLFDNFFALIH